MISQCSNAPPVGKGYGFEPNATNMPLIKPLCAVMAITRRRCEARQYAEDKKLTFVGWVIFPDSVNHCLRTSGDICFCFANIGTP